MTDQHKGATARASRGPLLTPAEILLTTRRLQIFNLFVSVIGVIYIQRVPRRTLWLGSTVAMLVLYSMFTAASAVFDKTGNRNAGRAAVAMIFLYNGAYDLSYSIMYYSYVLEVLPYRMRTKGMALSLAVDYGVRLPEFELVRFR